MRLVPDHIRADWIGTLTDEDLLDVEARLHERFAVLERRHKKLQGNAYNLFRGPTDLMTAWDKWSRLNSAALARSLRPRRQRVAKQS
jgi:hypothetical protein